MAIETVTIFRADTGEAVKTLGELRASIKALKDHLEEAEVGTKDYADTLVQLQTQQAALKNAMHDTTYETDDQTDAFAKTAKAAKGLGTSYNALVRQMAALDQEFRNTEDTARRADLGKQILEINNQLKDLDAERGKFGRNVGNYVSHWEGLANVLKDMPSTLGKTGTQIKNVGQSMALVGKQPILGIIGLLAPLISKIAEGLKENETALGAIQKVGKALEPVAQFFEKILDKIAGILADVVDWVLELGANAGIEFNKIIGFAAGVGNAVLQFILTPVRETIAAVKGLGTAFKNLIHGDFKGAVAAAKDAGDGISQAFRRGISFKANFQAGQQVGEQFASGIRSTRKKAADAGREVAEASAESMLQTWDDMEKERQRREGLRASARELEAQNDKAFNDLLASQEAELTAALQEELDAQLQAEWDAKEAEKELMRERIDAAQGFASAVANVFQSIADIYEENGEADEKATAKAKGLRTAAAIISTISGMISAYMNTIESVKIPQLAIPLAVANAAAVGAAGYAQIRKINAVKVGSSASSAVVSAPSIAAPAVQQVRTVTGATEEDRLNRMADSSRVYILASDLQAERNSTRVRIQETEW